MISLPITPFIAAVLLLLPVKLAPRTLIKLAFFLWALGGSVLAVLGVRRMADASLTTRASVIIIASAIWLAVGIAKGRYVLAKTSQRNIERIKAMTEPQRPIRVYSLRSWVVISLTVLLSLALTLFNTPPFWRGGINLAVGFALLMSSINYLTTLKQSTPF
jgi:Na+/H+ antiporter NhaC